ncbi:acyl-CoA dehydrogenase [Saccharopolyspora antimicrobica]|uniref:Acyl-CoA dehydrogenase n=1 Tax=Saccharopolyspora antimicrobica TaxID=455193 RepID=A0A1I4W9S4_9PSEU|nr:acyl-CoA dehydrogenase family protein [Saccharopolyspora antimicrobica]RKT87018.1 acyl-CoA dehydrogenase [Saccharopolyspora antimicrobica]SFN09709.1 acyl-CoA dehydrogenase [Saccharopolyspora antimicrobica]
MDFHLGEELAAVRDLARDIFTDQATTDRIREVEASPTGVDEHLWAELAKAGLVDIALPEDCGGAGLGLAGLCVLLEEQGRAVAPVPLWSAGVAALTLAEHSVLAEGRTALALEEFAPAEPDAPTCTATLENGSWLLSGTKAVVPSPQGAAAVLVSATSGDGPGLFLVDADGLRWEPVETTARGRSAHLHLDRAAARPIGGAEGFRRTLRRATVALSAVQTGVMKGALALAAGYLAERHQFGRPLATFQAVRHQLADCYIDVEAVEVTLWQAITSLADDAPDADRAVLVAKWWADQAGLDVVHRTQHVHGGIGVDIDYPAHRYFLWGKEIAGTFGGAAAALADLGAHLAAAEVTS